MVSCKLVFANLSTLCLLFAVTTAHEEPTAPSSISLTAKNTQSLDTSSQTRLSTSSNRPLFIFTPPFSSQTLFSISVPPCPPHDPSLSPLGCKEPTTSPSATNSPPSTLPTLPIIATNVVWKTITVTVTSTRTVFGPRRSTSSTYTSNSKEPKLQYRNKLESITTTDSEGKITVQAITTVTSILDGWGIPQEPNSYTPPPLPSATDDASSALTTLATTPLPPEATVPVYGNPNLSASPTIHNQYPPPIPCSANTAQ